jgi:hypothetical protein
MAAFIVGLTPGGTHWGYMDTGRVEPAEQAAPSSAASMSLLTGLIATEVLVLLLGWRAPRAIPRYMQFDARTGKYRRGRLRWGNRGPVQRLKRAVVERKFRGQAQLFEDAGFEPLPTPANGPGSVVADAVPGATPDDTAVGATIH